MKGRGLGFWVLLGALLFGSAILLGRGRTEGPPLDPDATNALGTRAVTELIDELGGDVDRRLPEPGDDVVLVLVDRGIEADQRTIERFVSDGGTAVIADSESWLSPNRVDLADDPTLARGICTIDRLGDVAVVAADRLTRFDVGASDQCFSDGERGFIVEEPFGAGTLVHVGDPYVFTNDYLDEEDNAVLAARLLLPSDNARVAVVYDSGVVAGAGEDTLWSLIPTRVRWFALQLTVAFALLVLWRARRFGRVVTEPIPVEMPGSLLVQASGELRRRAKGHGEAIASLRLDLERRLRAEFRVPNERPTADLVREVSARSSLTEAQLEAALTRHQSSDAEGLVAVAAAVDHVAATVLAAPTPPPELVSAPASPGHDTLVSSSPESSGP